MKDGAVSIGNVPGFDMLLGNTLCELKITSNRSSRVHIEYSRYDGSPSGLALSDAEYYVIFSVGYDNVCNVRFVETKGLKEVMNLLINNPDPSRMSAFKPVKNDKGSRSFWIDLEARRRTGNNINNIDSLITEYRIMSFGYDAVNF